MLHAFLQQYKDLVQLNEVQQQAVEHFQGPLLLLASPGSGKTTTIIMRIGYLVSYHKVQAHQIIAVSFSKASARDMSLRYERFFPELPKVKFSTIHSLAFEIVIQGLRKQGISYEVIDGYDKKLDEEVEDQEVRLHKNIILRQLYEKLFHEKLKDELLDELLSYISYVKNKMIPSEQWNLVPCKVKQADELLRMYEQFKQSQDKLLLDFDDMLVYAEKTLREDLAIRNMYKRRYRFMLTDESQDTSLIQHHIIALLVEDHQNLCVVADDDQSIYSWRGAEPSYLLSFKEHYHSAVIMYMEQNYRSSQEIVTVANQFIRKNHNRYAKHMFTNNSARELIHIHDFPSVQEEINYIAGALQQSDQLQEVAVLYRNHYSSIMLVNELDRRGIPFYMKDGDDRFFSHWVVEDILNFMRLSYTDRRMDIFEKLAMKMNVYLSKQQILQCKQLHEQESIFELLLAKVKLNDYQPELIIRAQQTVQSLRDVNPVEAIRLIRNDLGYDKAIIGLCERLGFRKEYLMSILNSLEGIAEGQHTLEQFANRLKELEQAQKQAKNKKREAVVTLSTLHSAKGLEFNVVYMMDLVQQVIPSRTDQDSVELMEEAARLFYVGMTRARHSLHLITLQKWQNERAKTSEFVQAVKGIQNLLPMMLEQTISSQIQQKLDHIVNHQSSTITQFSTVKNVKAINVNAIKDANMLEAGLVIIHEQFGEGTIEEVQPPKIKINFVKHGLKTLQVEMCITQGLLELQQEQKILNG
ncbi:ATP-dependent helicase [Paenibacillus endoradicis]|uniref:ATP-dependent helicase n=1 Tax=Paenibacillus endoradicis TaxID=2972487 RepID=UPI0021596531|nr:ATP-dependent helicase [Paenibacillus endoradicis]MCR8657833.1 ATP-dependent helicase [Paenibacillus endoradicis]